MKKILYLASCMLLALCFISIAPTRADAAAGTYKCITPFERYDGEDSGLESYGGRYFWANTSSTGQLMIRHSKEVPTYTSDGTLLANFSSSVDASKQHSISLVTNGDIVYYVTPGNVLYKKNLAAGSSAVKLYSLNTTMKSRLSTDAVSVRACALYGDLLYLCVQDINLTSPTVFNEYIYSYNLSTKALTRVKTGRFLTENGRYFIYESNSNSGLYRYDMKTKSSKTILTGISGATACTYNSKLYLCYTNSSGKHLFREYTYSDLSYRSLKTFSSVIVGGYCYNGYLYYVLYSNSASTYYKLNIATPSQTATKVTTTTWLNNSLLSGSACHFHG